MGALVALEFAVRQPAGLSGVVSSAIPLQPTNVASGAKMAAAKLLSRVWPTFPMRIRLDTSALSRDPAVVQAYEGDPLVHDRGTARWGAEAMAVTRWLWENGGRLRLPVLLIHGAADRIASPDGSRRLHDILGARGSADDPPTSTLRVYPGVFHEPHNDLDREAVYTDIATWIEARSSSPSSPSSVT
jgi:alpha-beta hydrolase superfamily lysophospholipase